MKNFLKKSWIFTYEKARAIGEDISSAWWKIILAVCISAGTFFVWGISASALWFVFVMFLLYKWDNRYLGALAIVCLSACPVLLAANTNFGDDAAEQVAVWAFFFLVMTVVLQIVELKREDDTKAPWIPSKGDDIRRERQADNQEDDTQEEKETKKKKVSNYKIQGIKKKPVSINWLDLKKNKKQ